MHILREQGAEFGHLGSVSLVLNITQTHFVHRVGAEFGHLGSVSLLNIIQTHFVHRGEAETVAGHWQDSARPPPQNLAHKVLYSW